MRSPLIPLSHSRMPSAPIVRCKKTEWLPATADLLLAIRRLALIEFKVWIKESQRDYERFRLCIRVVYKNEKAAPLDKNEASNLERETIEYGVNSLLAAMFAPRNRQCLCQLQ